jgi:uncharacterized iron-regulated membrane protein
MLHRTIWRWHFYAGLFCIPFVTWLSITGAIYIFKPQIETWLDRPYDHLAINGPRASADAQVRAAMAAVPGSSLHDYELPTAPDSSVRVLVGKGAQEFRVYVHPQTLQILHVADEEKRPMRILFKLHGELLAGEWGSMIVELAASWAIVMILTGLYLWWPRKLFFPRLGSWKDIHSVTGIWISFCVLFLLISGLPWAKTWGNYLKKVRQTTQAMDWPVGGHEGHARHHMAMAGMSYAPIDRIAATVTPLHLAYPVLISPPANMGGKWTARSDAANRTLRVNMEMDGATGAILSRQNFDQKYWIDRAVGVGIAAHEGQLFFLNQLVNLLTAIGLNILNISAIMMWWKRKPEGVLGAPKPLKARNPAWIWVPIALLCVWLPLLGASIILVFLTERLVLRRIQPAALWLGLL